MTGIYKIQSIIKPERCYIGSAVDIKSRWRSHRHYLNRNKHGSIKLQRHYNKYKETDLIFSVIICCEKEELLKYEQFFIDAYNPWFNLCKIAGNNLGFKRPEETRAKMRGNKNAAGKRSLESLENMRKAHTGLKRTTIYKKRKDAGIPKKPKI